MCTKYFFRESWSWSSFFSSSRADFQRTVTVCVAHLLKGSLGHGHRLFLFSSYFCGKKCLENSSRENPRQNPPKLRHQNSPTHFCRQSGPTLGDLRCLSSFQPEPKDRKTQSIRAQEIGQRNHCSVLGKSTNKHQQLQL